MRQLIRWKVALLLLGALVAAVGCNETTTDSKPRQCSSPGECESGERCSIDGVCTTEEQGCALDAECGPEEFCKDQTQCAFSACEPGAAGDAYCGKGYICHDEESVCVQGCRSKADCGENESCNEKTLLCENDGCTIGGNECGDFKTCVEEGGVKRCKYDQSCSCDESLDNRKADGESDREFCKRLPTGDKTCELWAAQNGRGGGYICEDNTCKSGQTCNRDDECNSGEICVDLPVPSGGTRQVCREGCKTTEQCQRQEGGEGKVCRQNESPIYPWKTCQVGCQGDGDCSSTEGEVCVQNICVKQCDSSSECFVQMKTDGFVCEPGPGTGTHKVCRGCERDSECNSGDHCDFDELPAIPNQGLCKEKVTCPDDGYGKNTNHNDGDVYAIESLPFKTGVTVDGKEIKDPYICRSFKDNGDWFSFTIPANNKKIVKVKIDYGTNDGNIDLQVFEDVPDTSATLKAADHRPPESDKGQVEVNFGVDTTASSPSGVVDKTFYLRVTGSLQNVSDNFIQYSLSIEAEDEQECNDATNTSQASAKVLNPGVGSTQVRENNQRLCGNSGKLYYKIEPGANKAVRFTARSPERLGKIDVSVFKESGGTLHAVGNRLIQENVENTEEEAVGFFTGSSDGKSVYYVTLSAVDGVGYILYDYVYDVVDNQCADAYEPTNDECKLGTIGQPGGAPLLTGGQVENLAACTDADYYCMQVTPDAGFDFTMCEPGGRQMGAIQLSFVGPGSCETVYTTSAPTVGADKSCRTYSLRNLKAGYYCANISLFSGMYAEYSIEYTPKAGAECTKDHLGDNNTFANATAFDSARAREGKANVIEDAFFCDSEADWYSVELKAGDRVEFKVTPTPKNENGKTTPAPPKATEQDLDLRLYFTDDQDSNRKESSSSIPDPLVSGSETETLTYEAKADGTYYLKVVAKSFARTRYRVQLTINGKTTPNPECSDEYEMNNTAAAAMQLPLSTTPTSSNSQLTVCTYPNVTADSDYYKFELKAGETLRVDISVPNEVKPGQRGNLKMEMFEGTQTEMNGAEIGTDLKPEPSNPKFAVYTAPKDQWIYLLVSSPGINPFSYKYSLSWEKTDAVPCVAESHGNDESDPIQLDPVTQVKNNVSVCGADVDWYQVTIPKGKTLNVLTRYDREVISINTQFKVGGSNLALAGVDIFTGKEKFGQKYTIAKDDKKDRDVLISVSGVDNARGKYALILDYDGAYTTKKQLDCPDTYEDNDSVTSAKRLRTVAEKDLLICTVNPPLFKSGKNSEEDNDYFVITVPPKAELSVDVAYDAAVGDIDAKLYAASNKAVAIDTSDSTNVGAETLHVTNSGDFPADYYVQVYPKAGAKFSNYYNISYKISYPDTCNDFTSGKPSEIFSADVDDATAMTQATTKTQQFDGKVPLCENHKDWFYLGDDITSFEGYILFQGELGTMKMSLLNESGGVVGQVSSSGAELKVDSLTSAPTKYFLKVEETDKPLSRRMTYQLWYKTNVAAPAVNYCGDTYELNNLSTFASEIALTSGVFQSGVPIMCGDEVDWYKVNLAAGDYYMGLLGDGSLTLHAYKSGDLNTAAASAAAGVAGTEALNGFDLTADASDYYLKVAGGAAGVAKPYTMLVYSKSVFDGASCPKDSFEKHLDSFGGSQPNNDRPNIATPIVYSEYKNSLTSAYATLCNNDPADWYSITEIGSGKKFSVTVYAPANVNVTLMSLMGNKTTDEVSGSGTVTHTFTQTVTDSLSFGVKGSGADFFPYYITVKEVP